MASVLVRAATLAALGATVGTVLDYAHVANGAVAYTHPVLFGLAWWVPLLYASAALAVGLSHPLADAVLRRKPAQPLGAARLAGAMAAFLAIWFASGALKLSSPVLAGILGAASLMVWWIFDRTGAGFALAVATAAGGVATESVLVHFGAFHHTSPDVLGVAWWLPTIYVAASVAVGNVGRRLAV